MGFFDQIFSTSKRIIDGGKDVLKDQLGSTSTYQRGGDFTNTTVPNIVPTSKEFFFPGRGYSDEEITQAQPTLKDTVKGAARGVTEIGYGLGELGALGLMQIPAYRRMAEGASQSKIGGALANAGQAVSDFTVPKTVGEAKIMRGGDILGFVAAPTKASKISKFHPDDVQFLSKNILRNPKMTDRQYEIARGIFQSNGYEAPTSKTKLASYVDDVLESAANKQFDQRMPDGPASPMTKAQVNETLQNYRAGKANPQAGFARNPLASVANQSPTIKTKTGDDLTLGDEVRVIGRDGEVRYGIIKQIKDPRTNNAGQNVPAGFNADFDNPPLFGSLIDPSKWEIEKVTLTPAQRKAIVAETEASNAVKNRIFGKQTNPKLQAFREGRGNSQGGYIANPLGRNTPDNQSVSSPNRTTGILPIDQLIADNKVRVVSRDGKDVYQVKQGEGWRNVRDEDSAIKQATPKPKAPRATLALPDELEERKLAAEIAQEALDNDPLNALTRFTAKTGENKGTLREVTGKASGKFANQGDDIVTELGFADSESARDAYEQFARRKAEVAEELAETRKAIKEYKAAAKTAPKAQTPSPLPVAPKVRPVRKEEVTSLEAAARPTVEQANLPERARPKPLEDIVTQTPLDNKVNILDYIRTPNRVLNKIGFGKEAKLVRESYDNYAKELPENIATITAWTKRVTNDKATRERLFDYLDGKAVKLSPTEQKVADEIRDYLRTWADRLGLPEDKRVTNYITRLFDDQLIAKEFDEDLAKIIRDKIPGEVYNPFLQERLGAKGYRRDVWDALDAYTKRATRKVHLDPALERIREKAGSELAYSPLEESQFNYIKRYIDRVQMRPTEFDNIVDNAVKQVVGYRFGQRPVTNITRTLRQLTYKGMLGGNIGSALRNLSQGVNTYAVLGEKYTAIGYTKLFQPAARREAIEQGIFENNFIEDRTLSSTRQALQKFDKALWYFFDQAEKTNRAAAYHGAKAKGLSKGMSEQEAIDYGKEIVRKTQFNYDSIDAPVALGSDLTKTLFQFQTFTTKQTEFLAEMVKDKNVVGLMRYALGGYVFVNTIGSVMGMEEKELLPVYRFDVPPSLKFPVELGKAAVDAPDKYGNDRDLGEKAADVGKAALGVIPGGLQMRKTVQGAEAIEDGGSFDAGGRLQFEQGQTLPEKAQTLTFGKYANQKAKDYFNKETNTGDTELDAAIEADRDTRAEATETATKTYLELKALPNDEANTKLREIFDTDRDLYKKIMEKKAQDDRGLTDEEKGIERLGVTSGARAKFIFKKFKTFENPDEGRAYLKMLREKKVISDQVLEQLKELRQNDII